MSNTGTPPPKTRLSILDTAMVGAGTTVHETLEGSIALAQRADELGFIRYWMAEHHGVPGVASSAPVVTIGALAAATHRIRVGSGGVMLPNHVPLVIAEQFGTLAALYPGRVDLGVGRASPDPYTAAILQRALVNYGSGDLQDQIEELAGFLTGRFPEGHPYRGVFVSPRPEQPAAIWVLGASVQSAELAASLGLPFAFAHHFGRGGAASALEHYRQSFRPSASLDAPRSIVTAHVICAPTDEEADRIGLSAALMFLRLGQGRPGLLPTPQEVAAHTWTAQDLAFVRQRYVGQAVGSPDTVRESLSVLLESTGADELMMTTQMYSPADRVRSLDLVAGLFAADGAGKDSSAGARDRSAGDTTTSGELGLAGKR